MYSRRSVEEIVLGLVAFILSGALLRVLSGGGDTLDGDLRAQIVLAVLYLAVLVIVFSHLRCIAWIVRRNRAIFGLLFLALLSALSSEMPDLVFRRTVALAGTTLFGIVLATRFTFVEQLKLIRWVFRISAGLSLTALLVAPNFAASGGVDGNGLRGIFNHKNHFGAAMALGFLVELYLPEIKPRLKTLRIMALCAYMILLLFSNSLTSIVALVVTLFAIQTFTIVHSRFKLPLPVLFAVVLFVGGAVAAVEVNTDSITELLGRSSDLTGRTELWSYTFGMILKRPLLGFGYSGFWEGASAESVSVQRQVGWTPIYSHNGYLEILLSLGLVGLLVFLFVVGTGIRRALIHAEINKSAQGLWPLAFFIFFIIHNLAECTILLQNCLEWALCVATVAGSDPRQRHSLAAVVEAPDTPCLPNAECV